MAVQLFWTGGWDSTFRLLQLTLLERRDVQPIYVIDPERLSTLREVQAMQKIRMALGPRLNGVAVAPTTVRVRTDYSESSQLRIWYDDLKSRVRIGSQYLWLAVVAETEGWEGVELCMPRHEPPSDLQREIFERPGTSDPTLRPGSPQLFAPWSFPALHLTKGEMRELAVEQDFYDLLVMRWFCFRPIGERPCGVCNPCRIAREDRAMDGLRFASRASRLASKISYRFGLAERPS